MTDKWDWVPNDYKPSCVDCEAVQVCPLPQRFIDLLGAYMSKLALMYALKGESIPHVTLLADEAIDEMQEIVRDTVAESSQSKVINFLKLMNWVTIQQEKGDTTLIDKIKEMGGTDGDNGRTAI